MIAQVVGHSKQKSWFHIAPTCTDRSNPCGQHAKDGKTAQRLLTGRMGGGEGKRNRPKLGAKVPSVETARRHPRSVDCAIERPAIHHVRVQDATLLVGRARGANRARVLPKSSVHCHRSHRRDHQCGGFDCLPRAALGIVVAAVRSHIRARGNRQCEDLAPTIVLFHTRGTNTPTLPPTEFIGRFLQHILPDRFVRIHRFGIVASGNIPTKLQRARAPWPSASDSSIEYRDGDHASLPAIVISDLPCPTSSLALTGVDVLQRRPTLVEMRATCYLNYAPIPGPRKRGSNSGTRRGTAHPPRRGWSSARCLRVDC